MFTLSRAVLPRVRSGSHTGWACVRWFASGKTVKVLFGSQTGTAQGFAKSLVREGKKLNMGATLKLVDLDSYEPEALAEEDLVVLITATYGQGEPTDNAKKFAQWLLDNRRQPHMLKSLRYALFGLGSQKTYPERYQAWSRRLDARLSELGAHPIMPRGEGDDSGTLEEDFIAWRSQFWPALRAQLGDAAAPQGAAPTPGATLPAAAPARQHTHVLFAGDADAPLRLPYSARVAETLRATAAARSVQVHHAPVLVNRELHTPQSARSCRHVELAVRTPALSYAAGDHLAVFPRNSDAAAALLARHLHVQDDMDKYIQLAATRCLGDVANPAHDAGADGGGSGGGSGGGGGGGVLDDLHLPRPATLRDVLLHSVDLNAPPTRDALEGMATFALDKGEAASLAHMAEAAGSEAFHAEVTKAHRTFADVLARHSSVRMPLGAALELLPPLQPRFYSISSSPRMHPDSIHLTVAVVREATPDVGRAFIGLCSGYLARAAESNPFTALPVYVRPSTFRLPADPTLPVVLVGAGSGIAPLRAFLQERAMQRRAGAPVGPTILFFGCRNRAHDLLYKEELDAYAAEGVLTELHTAFSHETEQLVFVQHRLLERGAALHDLLAKQRAHLYVCGDARTLAAGVQDAVVRIMAEHGGLALDRADVAVRNLQSSERYQQDVF